MVLWSLQDEGAQGLPETKKLESVTLAGHDSLKREYSAFPYFKYVYKIKEYWTFRLKV